MKSIHTIIPYYNSSSTIADTLDSIKNQLILPSKITIINDCSSKNETEELLEICSNYKLNFEMINLDKNIGVANLRFYAMKNILKSSKSNIFHFLDSDDLIHPYFYSYSLKFNFKKNTIISFSHQSFSNIREVDFKKKIDFDPLLKDNKFYKQGSPSKNLLFIYNKNFNIPSDLSHRLRFEDWIFYSILKMNYFDFKKSMMKLSFYRRILKYGSSRSNRFISLYEINRVANLMSKYSGIDKKTLLLSLCFQEIKKSRFILKSLINAVKKNI